GAGAWGEALLTEAEIAAGCPLRPERWRVDADRAPDPWEVERQPHRAVRAHADPADCARILSRDGPIARLDRRHDFLRGIRAPLLAVRAGPSVGHVIDPVPLTTV